MSLIKFITSIHTTRMECNLYINNISLACLSDWVAVAVRWVPREMRRMSLIEWLGCLKCIETGVGLIRWWWLRMERRPLHITGSMLTADRPSKNLHSFSTYALTRLQPNFFGAGKLFHHSVTPKHFVKLVCQSSHGHLFTCLVHVGRAKLFYQGKTNTLTSKLTYKKNNNIKRYK